MTHNILLILLIFKFLFSRSGHLFDRAVEPVRKRGEKTAKNGEKIFPAACICGEKKV